MKAAKEVRRLFSLGLVKWKIYLFFFAREEEKGMRSEV